MADDLVAEAGAEYFYFGVGGVQVLRLVSMSSLKVRMVGWIPLQKSVRDDIQATSSYAAAAIQ